MPIHEPILDIWKFPIQKWEFLFKVKEIKELHGGVLLHAAQAIPQIDPREIGSAFHGAGADIGQKGHLWMETT